MFTRASDPWDLTASESWFVYLLRSADCTAFKIGFTCNPLQRLYSFNHRYFEGFDLYQSWLLQLDSSEQAREVESSLKTELAAFRNDAPAWVAEAAGGYTEWFSATHFEAAETRLRTCLQIYSPARVLLAAEVVCEHLSRCRSSFEHWASMQAQIVTAPRSFSITQSAAREAARSLRDWLDAYRYCDIELFSEDRNTLQFVRESVRHSLYT